MAHMHAHLRLHHMLLKLTAAMPSFAPAPRQHAKPAPFAPARRGAASFSLARASHATATHAMPVALAAAAQMRQREAATGYRAVIAAAHAQAAKVPANLGAERYAMLLPRPGNNVSGHPFVPMAQSRAVTSFGPRAQSRAGGILKQFVPTDAASGTNASILPNGDGHMASCAPGTAQPRPHSQPGGTTGTAYASTNQASTAYSRASLDDASRIISSASRACHPAQAPHSTRLSRPSGPG